MSSVGLVKHLCVVKNGLDGVPLALGVWCLTKKLDRVLPESQVDAFTMLCNGDYRSENVLFDAPLGMFHTTVPF